ncbi:phosphoribosylglycinamide formyltransferase [Fulvitalea axinellae]|uniref:Phosphoribosylglycinamide formyltransferase n=1 Tax=Fulvitalea axinellae TaxID=1182444 RepID=A0AAU9CKS5_9BACT|nr:phosphoribosylglycinamide formyltransferase [Fulvitalea axinellae]
MKSEKRIAVFASGSGTNAENIIKYFQEVEGVEVVLLLSNKPDAYALTRAEKLGVPTMVFNRKDFYESAKVLDTLAIAQVDMVVLAGFLWMVPEGLLNAYPDAVVNIHPSLLPKYGGKGMYGSRVHEAVIKAGEAESGITVHYVNERYDEGHVIFQVTCEVTPEDDADSLAGKVHDLEYEYFPKVIESVLTGE